MFMDGVRARAINIFLRLDNMRYVLRIMCVNVGLGCFPFLAEGETNQAFGNVIGDEKSYFSLDIEESLYNFYRTSVVGVLMNFRHCVTI